MKLILSQDCKPRMWLAHLSSNLVAALAGLDVDDLPHGAASPASFLRMARWRRLGDQHQSAATTPVLLLLLLGLLLSLLPVLLLGPQPLLLPALHVTSNEDEAP